MNDDGGLWLAVIAFILVMAFMGFQAHHFKMSFMDLFLGANPVVVVNKEANK